VTGGFYDHVVPPHEGVPDPGHSCHVAPVCKSPPPQPAQQERQHTPRTGRRALLPRPPCLRPPCTNGSGTANYSLAAKFDFRRLGLRSAAMLISPYIPSGSVFQEPQAGPANTSQFEHSSIPATVKSLFGGPDWRYLTKRDAWAAPFDELLTLQEPRTDAPMHLPDAPSSGHPPPPPPPPDFRRCGNSSASSSGLPCQVVLRGRLCQDNHSLIGEGSASYPTVAACLDWCQRSPRCRFFGLTRSGRSWCIRWSNCTVPCQSVSLFYIQLRAETEALRLYGIRSACTERLCASFT
jgi:hypothetical protein